MHRRTAIAIIAAVCLSACGGGDSGTGPTTGTAVAGSYSLKTVNGSPLPYTIIAQGTSKLEITADVITLTANGSSSGSVSQLSTLRNTQNGQATTSTQTDAGTYTLNGSAISIKWSSDGSISTGSLSGNSMTITDQGLALVYSK
jgi:hypothetical protein